MRRETRNGWASGGFWCCRSDEREVKSYRFPEVVLVVMAKAPVPGRAKTRLIPALGAEGAAQLQSDLLRTVVGRLLRERLCPVQIRCEPGPDHPEFAALAEAGARLESQNGGDLGERMANAARQALETARHVVIVGTDVPELDPAYVEGAIRALRSGRDAVLGPVEDGGYCLLGLNRAEDALFRGMAWSTAGVAEETRRRLRTLGWTWDELPTLWDVDSPEDLVRLDGWRR
jgi:rSAM/selenodomain-associated transferase 1